MPILSVLPEKSYMPIIQTIPLYVHSFSRNFRLQFRVGVVNPQLILGKGMRQGVWRVPFERELVSSYKPSIHIIPLTPIVRP